MTHPHQTTTPGRQAPASSAPDELLAIGVAAARRGGRSGAVITGGPGTGLPLIAAARGVMTPLVDRLGGHRPTVAIEEE